MPGVSAKVIVCSCERTMPIDEAAITAGCRCAVLTADQLCRSQLDLYKSSLSEGEPLTVACTQESPLFEEIAEEAGRRGALAFVNVREAAGWSADARSAGPKMAALLAAGSEALPIVPLVSMTSEGVTLVYGRDEVAIEAGRRLAEQLDVTVLLSRPGEVVPPRVTAFPVLKGTITRARGHLGAFELSVDDYAQPSPSSRARLEFGPSRDGATSRCDLIVDLSGGTPLFPAHDLRSGYLRADPRDQAAVERVLFEASTLVGEFDKPRFITFDEALCAHSRSKKTGCTRCLELCPTGAISPAGNHVSIDPQVCAGCGSCAATCPTGAAAYALPPTDGLVRKLRTLLLSYRDAGGSNAVVLIHDERHGEPLIDSLARFGDGLPANVLPVRVNEITQVGPEAIAASFAYGACGVRFLARRKSKHDISGLARIAEMANTILAALGFGDSVVRVLEEDDPDGLQAALEQAPLGRPGRSVSAFLPAGGKRNVLELCFRELREAAPMPVDTIALGRGAPFGGVEVDVEGCTLCLSCASACPTHALSDNPDRPMLRFTESLCVQCGLCAATCPEGVIALSPRLDFIAWNTPGKVLKEEEPFHCITCAKPFGTRSTIERVLARLEGKHWMFSGSARDRSRFLLMCENCRIAAAMNEGLDPYGAAGRRPRTSDDYLMERQEPEELQ